MSILESFGDRNQKVFLLTVLLVQSTLIQASAAQFSAPPAPSSKLTALKEDSVPMIFYDQPNVDEVWADLLLSTYELGLPIHSPMNGKATWSKRHPIFGRRKFGFRFDALPDQSVLAARDGKVSSVRAVGDKIYITIIHQGGVSTTTRYTGETIVTPGENVVRGQPIGKIDGKRFGPNSCDLRIYGIRRFSNFKPLLLWLIYQQITDRQIQRLPPPKFELTTGVLKRSHWNGTRQAN